MRKINKIELDFYKKLIRKNKPEKWKDVQKKTDIRNYMLSDEQNYQCAYTEQRIDTETSHTDHYIKQSFILQGLFKPITIFNWENLFTSCNNEFYGAKYKDKHIKPSDYKKLINPVRENSSDYFKYTWFGEIIVKEANTKGINTVKLFNLNDSVLIEQRKVVAFQVKTMYNQFSLDELIVIIGKFESMIRYLHKQLKNN